MLAIAHWSHPGRINSSSPTFRYRYVRRVHGFSFRLLIFAVLDYILTSSLNSGLDTVSLTVLLPFQYPVFHIITLYFYSLLHYVILIFRGRSAFLLWSSLHVGFCWFFYLVLVLFNAYVFLYSTIFSYVFFHIFLYCILNSIIWCNRFLVSLLHFSRFVWRQTW